MRKNGNSKSSRLKRGWVLCIAAAATLGALKQTACIAFGSEEILRTINFCFVFDCQNGLFGGVVDPCPDPLTDPLDGTSTNLFVDCPNPNAQ